MSLVSELPRSVQSALYEKAPALEQYATALNVTAPRSISADSPRPTMIVVSGIPKSGVVGAWEVIYNRTDLTEHLRSVLLNVDLRMVHAPEQFCSLLQTRYGLDVDVNDFLFPNEPITVGAFANYKLPVNPLSYRFVGSLELKHWVDLMVEVPDQPLWVDVDSGIYPATTYSTVFDFTGLSVVEQCTAESYDPVLIAIALGEESGDSWECTDASATPLNTYNSTFIENVDGCLRIQLDPAYSELTGILTLKYEVSPE
jgi:hypothetical protein